MKRRKAMAKLTRRVTGYDDLNPRDGDGRAITKGPHGNYHKPGSLK